MTILGLIVVGLLWALRTERMQRWPFSRFGMNWLFLVATMGIGAGVIINLVTKPVWGRARPVHITQFGGASEFTPAWVIANQCKWNCSFVSGEAGATALVLAFCFVVPARWRLTTLIAGCLFTLLISFARIAVGGHFLSDVVTAWLLMLLVMFILRVQIYHDALLGPMRRWLPARRPRSRQNDIAGCGAVADSLVFPIVRENSLSLSAQAPNSCLPIKPK